MPIHIMIYLTDMFFLIWSLIDICWSIANKKKTVSFFLLISSIVGMAYLFSDINILPELLEIPTGSEELEIILLAFFAFFIYIISIIINIVKMIKYRAQTASGSEKSKLFIVTLAMILLPVVCISGLSLRDYFRIRSSDAVVILYSRRDTNRLLDNESFGYVIKEDRVWRFDLMVKAGPLYYTDEGMIPGEISFEKTRAEAGEYEVVVKNDVILILHDDMTIFTYPAYSSGFYNNEVFECYYRQ